MKKWTKKAIKEMCQSLDSFALGNRPLGDDWAGTRMPAWRAWLTEVLSDETRRTQIIICEMTSLRGLFADRAVSNRKTADHAKANPHVWGKSTQEIIDRFDRLESEELGACAYIDRKIARIQAEGLPPEVLEWIPLDRK